MTNTGVLWDLSKLVLDAFTTLADSLNGIYMYSFGLFSVFLSMRLSLISYQMLFTRKHDFGQIAYETGKICFILGLSQLGTLTTDMGFFFNDLRYTVNQILYTKPSDTIPIIPSYLNSTTHKVIDNIEKALVDTDSTSEEVTKLKDYLKCIKGDQANAPPGTPLFIYCSDKAGNTGNKSIVNANFDGYRALESIGSISKLAEDGKAMIIGGFVVWTVGTVASGFASTIIFGSGWPALTNALLMTIATMAGYLCLLGVAMFAIAAAIVINFLLLDAQRIILLALAPVMILCFAFEWGRKIGDAWVNALIKNLLASIMTTAFLVPGASILATVSFGDPFLLFSAVAFVAISIPYANSLAADMAGGFPSPSVGLASAAQTAAGHMGSVIGAGKDSMKTYTDTKNATTEMTIKGAERAEAAKEKRSARARDGLQDAAPGPH